MSVSDLQGALLGMCNPLLDISAEVPIEFLEKYNVQLNNAILAGDEHLALYPDLIKNYPVQYIAGGATQNSIRVAQWMLNIPGATSYFGAIGNDDYGNILEKCAVEDGVNVSYQKNDTVATGTCAVLVNNGERSLIANLAAANTFTEAHLALESSQAIIKKAKCYYCSGFFLTVSVPSMLQLAKESAENNKTFCINLSAPFLIQFFGEQMNSVMPYCDFVFGNESEAEAYGDAKGYGKDLSEIALKLAAQPKACGTRPRIVVFTQGSESTIVACEGNVQVFPVDKLSRDLLVDTNGAGDAFVGGYLSQYLLKKSISDCVRAGHFASRTIIQRSGCTFPKECSFI